MPKKMHGWQFDYRLDNEIDSVRHTYGYATLNNAFDAAQKAAREMEDKLGATIVQFYVWCYDV